MSQVVSASIRVNGRDFSPGPSGQVTIGRDASADVVIDDPRVSRHHLALQLVDGAWIARDLGSRNGTFLDGKRITEVALPAETRLRLGDGAGVEVVLVPGVPAAPARAPAAPPPAPAPGPAAARAVPATATAPARSPRRNARASKAAVQQAERRVRIGRAPDNDIALTDDIRVSRNHAELLARPDGAYEIVDVGSHNGTFVNGQRVQRAQLADGDVVTIGNHVFRFASGSLHPMAESGEAAFQATGLTVRTEEGKVILEDVSFDLEPSKLLAVVGPSGSGKTTLLNAITGFKPATQGRVMFGGRDLYASFDDLRQRIGFVPQDDILHPQLGVRKALEFAAELRFPPDVDAKAKGARVAEVMAELDLTQRADLRIERLSGGQRKRVSVALELLTKPSLLFLDEPTSGLDPGNERQVMALLRDLADGGRTVIVVTHSTQSLHLCDRILFMAPGGKMAFYGPPGEALDYFDRHGAGKFYADVFTQLEENAAVDWGGQFKADPAYEQYVGHPLAVESAALAGRPQPPSPPKRQQPWFYQFKVLVRRYLAVIAADRRTLLLLALQAPIFGFLFALLIGKNRISLPHGPEGLFLIWLLVVGATWLGVSNATREIVKELPIYKRERSVGLSIQAYLASKIAVLGALTIVQCVIMALIALHSQHPNDPSRMDLTTPGPIVGQMVKAFPAVFKGQAAFGHGASLQSASTELVVDVVLVGLAAMALGLLVSAFVKSSDQALVLLPLLLVTQVVVSQPFSIQANINQDPIINACAKGQPVPHPGAPQPAILKVLGYFSSAQWGKDAAASTVDMNVLRSLSLVTQAVGQRDIAVALGVRGAHNFTPCEVDGIFTTALTGVDRWRHDSGTWGGSIVALLLLLALPLIGAFYLLRRQDVHALSTGGPARRAGPLARKLLSRIYPSGPSQVAR